MPDLQTQIGQLFQRFIANISQQAKVVTAQALEDSLAPSRGKPSARSAVKVGRPTGGRAPKRTQEEMEELATQVLAYVRTNPGQRIEQINQALGTTTKDLALPIRKLVGDGQLVTKGQKRSTTYAASKKGRG